MTAVASTVRVMNTVRTVANENSGTVEISKLAFGGAGSANM